MHEKKIVQETVSGSSREGVAGRRENGILSSYTFALFTEHYEEEQIKEKIQKHVACIEEIRTAYTVLVGKFAGITAFQRSYT